MNLLKEYVDDLQESLELKAIALRNASLDGKCGHGHRQQIASGPLYTCLKCGKKASWEELDNDYREIMMIYF
jgi:hypothetical protein